MHWLFASSFCIIFVISIDGNVLQRQAFIYRDAIRMAGLVENIWSLKPDEFSSKGPLVFCNAINKCCSDEHRSQAISIAASILKFDSSDTNLTEFIETKCINSAVFDKENEWCSSFRSLAEDDMDGDPNVEDSDVQKYRAEFQEYGVDGWKLLQNAQSTCAGEELYSFLCLSNKNLIKTCARKLLQKFYDDNGYKVYQQSVRKIKNILINLNQKLSKIFKTNTNTN